MNNKLFISNSPFFLLNATDKHAEKLGISFPAVLMDSRHIEWRPLVAEKLKKITDVFIVDPRTDILLFKAASDGPNFKKLKYPKKIEPEKIYSEPELRKTIIDKAIDDQQKKGASLLIAPYFFTEDTDSVKFNTNLSFISETIRTLKEKEITTPLFAMLEIGNSVLNRPTVINYIVDRYKEDFAALLSGYIIVINDLDCETADQESLVELSRLVFQLSEKNSVIVNKIGPFGEILSAIGAIGFGSGLAGGEMFIAKNLDKVPEGWGKMTQRTYIPEIFDYLNDEDVKKIKYTCECNFCKGSYPKDFPSKKLHYLHTRIIATESLRDLTRDKRIDALLIKINNGIKITANMRRRAINVKTTFLPKWKAVLELAKFWEFPGDDSELNELLRELET